MKMRKMTRVSFSDSPHPAINLKLPTSWPELSQAELHEVYRILVTQAALLVASGQHKSHAQACVGLLCTLAGARVVRHDRPGDSFILSFPVGRGRRLCRVTPAQLSELLEPLDFIQEPGGEPVRLDQLDGKPYEAVNPRLQGVPFGEYIRIENLYQGFIMSKSHDAVESLAGILYPGYGSRKKDSLTAVDVFNILQWMIQVKTLFAHQWPNFFRPCTGSQSAPSMLEVMNNEIRALTGGDVSKEEMILQIDCWRALTELDFKAKEAEEHKREMAKYKK